MVTTPTGGRRTRRPNDPQRPVRIARAAIRVIAAHGIEALTHRKVAAEAEVPLGSTTYYFAGLDDLIAAALTEAADSNVAELREWNRALTEDADLAAALADFVLSSITEQRANTIAEYNLYAVALHRPHLRKAAADWDQALAEIFTERTDPVTGRMIATLTCGILMQSVLTDDVPAHTEIEAVFARALGRDTR